MNKAKYQNLIHKKLTNTLSVEDQRLLDQWLGQDADNQKLMEAVEDAWNLSLNYENNFEPDTELGLKKLKGRIQASKAVSNSSKVVPFYKSSKIWAIAASIMVLIGAFSVWKMLLVEEQNWQTIVATENSAESIELADGSKVWLNKDSKLEFPETFSDTKRIVKLSGEAYFEIAKDPEKRFIVQTTNSTVSVLGTSFNVKDFGEDQASISVKTGKVRFANIGGKTSKDLIANTKAVLTPSSNQIEVYKDPNLNDLSWFTGYLSFNDTPLETVVKDLNEHFNTSISINDKSLRSCRFTSPKVSSDIDLALARLEKVFGFEKIQSKENSILLTGGSCQ